MEPETKPPLEMEQALSSLLELAGFGPAEHPSAQDVAKAVGKLKLMLGSRSATPANSASNSDQPSRPNLVGKHQHILIAGQLGIVLHQLRQGLNKLGGEVTLVKDMDAAIEQYQKQPYSLVIIDLFMPTEREGMIVLDEINRIGAQTQTNSQIVVLAPVSKDNNLQDLCKSKGALYFLEKVDGWHNSILGIFMGNPPP